MDDYSNPIIITVLAILAIVELIVIFILYKKSKQENVTEEDVLSLVNEGQEDGNILAKEAEMIQNIFDFSDTDAKDIMTHRKNIEALDCEMTLKEAIGFINENSHSRYPVYKDDLDNIVGVLHIKDVLNCYNQSLDDKKLIEIPDLLGPVVSVTETHSINTLFSTMQVKKSHMIIVIDEYGQVSGILSMEDILEEIVGNIEDEHDEDESSIEKKSENTFLMDGSTTLEEAEQTLEIRLSENFETLNGYLVSLLGKIPEDGSSFIIEDDLFTYEIHDVSSKVIGEVLVKRKINEEASNHTESLN